MSLTLQIDPTLQEVSILGFDHTDSTAWGKAFPVQLTRAELSENQESLIKVIVGQVEIKDSGATSPCFGLRLNGKISDFAIRVIFFKIVARCLLQKSPSVAVEFLGFNYEVEMSAILRDPLNFQFRRFDHQLNITNLTQFTGHQYDNLKFDWASPRRFESQFAIACALFPQLFEKFPLAEAFYGLGSIARRIADEDSDIDIMVICLGSRGIEAVNAEFQICGEAVDLKIIDVQTSPPRSWNLIRKWAFGESLCLWSRSPSFDLTVQEDIVLSPNEQFDLVQCLILHLGWIGFQPRAWHRKLFRGYNWPIRFDSWIHRQDTVSAHKTVDKAVGYFVSLLYLINNRRFPGEKWKYSHLRTLNWLPSLFIQRFLIVFETKPDVSNFYQRAEVLVGLVEEVIHVLLEKDQVAIDIFQHCQECFKENRGYLDLYR